MIECLGLARHMIFMFWVVFHLINRCILLEIGCNGIICTLWALDIDFSLIA